MVSIEDIVEQIVGDIADEHDEEAAPGVVRQADGSFLADARAGLEDVTAFVGPEFDVGEVAKEVDTLGRLCGDPDRPCAGARRDRARARSVRDRDPRCRSSSGKKAQNLPWSGPAAAAAEKRAGGRPRPTSRRRPPAPAPQLDLPPASEESVKLSADATPSKTAPQPVTLTRLAHPIVLARGWRRILIAFLAGAATTLALPPTNIWPVAIRHLSDPGLAGRRGGRRPPRRRARGRDRRLVVRLRLFPRGPLLGRQCVPGRRQDLRLAAAIRRHRAAGRDGALHRARARAGAAHLDARRHARAGARRGAHPRGMAARPPTQRVPLEYLRLCAGLAAVAGARRGAHRDLGPDIPGGRGLCEPGGARRRPRRHQAARGCAGAERRGDRRACDLRRAAAGDERRRISWTACGFASCSPTCSRTRNSITRRSSRS